MAFLYFLGLGLEWPLAVVVRSYDGHESMRVLKADEKDKKSVKVKLILHSLCLTILLYLIVIVSCFA